MKLRLCQFTSSGKLLAVGFVDTARCNQKEAQFFESVKPLVEGANFQSVARNG
jgi:hypothetical protein